MGWTEKQLLLENSSAFIEALVEAITRKYKKDSNHG